MRQQTEEVIVLFKTHLDMGFTDMARNVVDTYMNCYIPKALETAREMERKGRRFIWTTGSWMIREYLRRSSGEGKEAMEEAIRKGSISWHGLPFTTHTEIMDRELFWHGLQISAELDAKYQKQTVAAKMTDVPGHTIQMVPLLAEEGIRFLHIGVNEACRPPAVPPLFRWRAPDGSEVTVLYQSGYGREFLYGKTAVYFAHTNDNLGPQSAEEVEQLYGMLEKKFPKARIRAGSLNDVADAVCREEDKLPVITEEIGDTWIHGTGTDPCKMSQFKQLLRMRAGLGRERRAQVNDWLLLVAEHTWGLDEKTFLHDTEHFEKEQFAGIRREEGYRRMERSWEEQRGWLRRAAEAFGPEWQEVLKERLEEYRRPCPYPEEGYGRREKPGERIDMDLFRVEIDENGAICYLERNGRIWADAEHLWAVFEYEVFSQREYDRYLEQYLIAKPDWAVQDNSKPGMEKAISEYCCVKPEKVRIYRRDRELLVIWQMPQEQCKRYGCPRLASYVIRFGEDRIDFDLGWWRKDATRVAEAVWFSFEPLSELAGIGKLGGVVSVDRVVKGGSQRIHGTDGRIVYRGLTMELMDSSLVSTGCRSLLDFSESRDGEEKHRNRVCLNLYNNVWGTNFPMWYEEDARFRIAVEFRQEEKKC